MGDRVIRKCSIKWNKLQPSSELETEDMCSVSDVPSGIDQAGQEIIQKRRTRNQNGIITNGASQRAHLLSTEEGTWEEETWFEDHSKLLSSVAAPPVQIRCTDTDVCFPPHVFELFDTIPISSKFPAAVLRTAVDISYELEELCASETVGSEFEEIFKTPHYEFLMSSMISRVTPPVIRAMLHHRLRHAMTVVDIVRDIIVETFVVGSRKRAHFTCSHAFLVWSGGFVGSHAVLTSATYHAIMSALCQEPDTQRNGQKNGTANADSFLTIVRKLMFPHMSWNRDRGVAVVLDACSICKWYGCGCGVAAVVLEDSSVMFSYLDQCYWKCLDAQKKFVYVEGIHPPSSTSCTTEKPCPIRCLIPVPIAWFLLVFLMEVLLSDSGAQEYAQEVLVDPNRAEKMKLCTHQNVGRTQTSSECRMLHRWALEHVHPALLSLFEVDESLRRRILLAVSPSPCSEHFDAETSSLERMNAATWKRWINWSNRNAPTLDPQQAGVFTMHMDVPPSRRKLRFIMPSTPETHLMNYMFGASQSQHTPGSWSP